MSAEPLTQIDETITKPENVSDTKKTSKKRTAKKKHTRKARSAGSDAPVAPKQAKKKTRRTTLFPASSFEEALTIPNSIQKYAAGQKVRRLTLFDQMQKSPDSGPSRQMIINANKYGLIKGNYSSEYLELTAEGKTATSTEVTAKDRLTVQFKLAITQIPPFKAIFESQKGNRLPALSVLEDKARENEIPDEDARECVEIFVVNAKYLGILKSIAGAERIIPIEQAIEEAQPRPETAFGQPFTSQGQSLGDQVQTEVPVTAKGQDFEQICFYISPIGEEGSEQRIHADLFLGSLVEPALEEFNLKVVRADNIGKPGMITAQILEYILKSKLVIADLSFHNPNVFYELSLRHTSRLPTVQIIRKIDKIPFDLDQFRTIQIDTTSIFTMVPNLQTYKAEITTQVRTALKDPDSVDNPISTYYPKLRVSY
jgi:hypothetical protein